MSNDNNLFSYKMRVEFNLFNFILLVCCKENKSMFIFFKD